MSYYIIIDNLNNIGKLKFSRIKIWTSNAYKKAVWFHSKVFFYFSKNTLWTISHQIVQDLDTEIKKCALST